MGRRATRRRHKKKYKKLQAYHSDPEDFRGSSEKEPWLETTVRGGHSWDSLDDLALIDYANNAVCGDPATIRDQMEVTRRLSSLNVSCCGNDLCTSDVETIYSEFPPSATLMDNLPGEFVPLDRLKERQCRKRSSKRNRKRTKKIKAQPITACSTEENVAIPVGGKHRRPSQGSKLRFNPIAWVHPSTEPPWESSSHKNPTGSTDTGAHVVHHLAASDSSSRSLTDSDSPTLDDIIMIGSGQEDDEIGVVSMEGLELNSHNTPTSNPDLVSSSHTHSQKNSESELTDSTSDSGCDGDDEESSVELTGSLKINGIPMTSSSYRRGMGTKTWLSKRVGGIGGEDRGFSSTEEIYEEDPPSTNDDLSVHGRKGSMKVISQTQPWLAAGGSNMGSEFKNPQQWGIKGNSLCVSSSHNKQKKKIVPTIASPQDLSNRIKYFIQFNVELEMNLPMMSRALCRMASSLADIHNLDYFVFQKRRLPVASPVLRKTCCTRLASDSEIEEVLKNHRKEVLNSVFSPKKNRRTSTNVTTHLPIHVPVSVLPNNIQKKLVGSDAPRIGDSNIGNQILQNMGWRPGIGLGKCENGMKDPLFAEIRPKTAGLGYT